MGPAEQLLRDAWAIIEDPAKRCSYYCALDINNLPVESSSKDACRWCSLGAIGAAAKETDGPVDLGIYYLVKANEALSHNEFVSVFSDNDIINNPPKLYELAIELAAKAGA